MTLPRNLAFCGTGRRAREHPRFVNPARAALKEDPGLKQETGLRRIGAGSTECQSRRRTVCSDIGKLGARKEDLVLIGRRQGYRPRVAPGTVQQIRRAICEVARRGDVFEANGHAEPGERRVFAKAVIGQYCSAISRRGGKCADRGVSWYVRVLEIRSDGPRRRVVIINESKKCLVVLEQRRCSRLKKGCRRRYFGGVGVIAAGSQDNIVGGIDRISGRTG